MMKTIKLVLSITLGVLFSTGVIAQNNLKKGTIQLSKKKHIDAYIYIDFTKPQNFQSTITYITPKSYESYLKKGKIKGKKKLKLKAKEIIGFSLDDGTTFKTVKYVDLNKKGLGMLPKTMCLEQIATGKVDAYKMYSKTSGKMTYELSNAIMDSKMQGDQLLIDYIQNNFQILVQKDSKNPKNIMYLNLINLIGDNETVKTNYDNNHYGFQHQFVENSKKGVFVHTLFEQTFLKMINAYNGKTTVAMTME